MEAQTEKVRAEGTAVDLLKALRLCQQLTVAIDPLATEDHPAMLVGGVRMEVTEQGVGALLVKSIQNVEQLLTSCLVGTIYAEGAEAA